MVYDGTRVQPAENIEHDTTRELNTYPYDDHATTPEGELERATFDVVATSISRHIPSRS